jgi:SWI/SNF-related matrix-associated actin-dependent regulator of chromatin subfamily A-like protein 1
MTRNLFPYQIEGVEFLLSKDGRALLADEMGLGKSCQASVYLRVREELRPALIVCPASLKLNWERELRQWGITEKITVINGSKQKICSEGITIVNYDVVYNYYQDIEDAHFKVMILDESHYVKNVSARRTKAVKYIGKGIQHIICISGTPITSRPKEFYTTLNLLNSSMFNNHDLFLREYCNLNRDPSGRGASNTQKLNDILTQSFMIRRKKVDVLKDLPPKIRSIVPMEINNREEYNEADADLIKYIRENYGHAAAVRASFAETMVRFEKLKQLSAQGKLGQVVEWMENFLDSGEKLAVFCTHKTVVNSLMEKFPDVSVKIDGSVSGKNRQKAVDDFQTDDKIRLFIGNIQAAGVGITLTAASSVAIIEFPWTPGEMVQVEDRCHRIGSVGECINIYYLVAVKTIEEEIASILDRKTRVLANILDGKNPEADELLTELIRKYGGENV